MPTQETYLLRLHRNRAVGGWQWAARLERLGGESRRFSDPEVLLAYLRSVLQAGDPADSPAPADAPTPIEGGWGQDDP